MKLTSLTFFRLARLIPNRSVSFPNYAHMRSITDSFLGTGRQLISAFLFGLFIAPNLVFQGIVFAITLLPQGARAFIAGELIQPASPVDNTAACALANARDFSPFQCPKEWIV